MRENNSSCQICGVARDLDGHHVDPRGMGGTRDTGVHDEANLLTLCRQCHRNIHEGRWKLVRSPEGIQVLDAASGDEIMRRLYNLGVEVPLLFEMLNLAEESLSRLNEALPYLTDEQLTEAFRYACALGKRSWLVQSAILHETRRRSTYGDRTLEAIARRFDIGLRQAQKYALVWKVFFDQQGEGEDVNIDAILLDQPSWYVVASTETNEPEKRLAYAQDRKVEDSRYSVFDFRKDIRSSHTAHVARHGEEAHGMKVELPSLDAMACPWVRRFCIRSGKPVPYSSCTSCEFDKAE